MRVREYEKSQKRGGEVRAKSGLERNTTKNRNEGRESLRKEGRQARREREKGEDG